MENTAIWDQVRLLLGLEELRAAQTPVTIGQILIVGLATVLGARWTSDRFRGAARIAGATSDIVSLVGRGAAFLVYAIGIAVSLSIAGINPTAIAAILGAATLGMSLALQDVAKAFVNGVYVMVERPVRIGDRVRIEDVEGRVEEIGIRLMRNRTDAGERVLLPSTLIFSSMIENATVGNFDRRTYKLSGIERPILEIEPVVIQVLRGTPHLSNRLPVVEVISTGPLGTRAHVTVEHDRGHRIDDQVMSRLRAEFSEPSVTTGLVADTT